MNKNIRCVVLSGPAGSGKSTAADYLIDTQGYRPYKFADPIKDMLRALGMADAHLEGLLKETHIGTLNYKSARFAMQTLGTEWGREIMGADFWVKQLIYRVEFEKMVDSVETIKIVVDDARFDNEVLALKCEFDTLAINLEGRATNTENTEHASEAGISTDLIDMRVVNDCTIATLNGTLLDIVENW